MPTNFKTHSTEQRQWIVRKLKLAKLKKELEQLNKDNVHTKLVSSSISSINMDTSDFNTNKSYSKAFRHDSKVLSSSHNLKNILAKNQNDEKNVKSFVTSSIKNFDGKSDSKNDHFLMPPPLDNRYSAFKKLSSTATNNNIDNSSLSSSDVVCYKQPTIFSKWKVALNERGQLIIRGTINSGKKARSKPLVRMLSTRTIQSVCNHLYTLQGDIVDDKHELPDYVKDKFHSGFPNDWENVYEIWRTFVQQGSKNTFRWPTKVSDSDDDLENEVTEMIYASDNSEDVTSHSSSFKETRMSRKSSNLLQSNTLRCEVRDWFSQTCKPDIKTNSIRSVAVQTLTQGCGHNKENYEHKKHSSLSCSYTERKKDKLKDKLNVMMDTVLQKNCSHQCINKIVKIVDFINYVIRMDQSWMENPQVV